MFDVTRTQMKSVFRVVLVALSVNASICLAEDKVSLAGAEGVALDLQNAIPKGWTCTLVSQKGKMGHPHGLEEPLFRLDFANTNLTFRGEITPGQSQLMHPNLRLHFHAIAERERILKTIKAEQIYSWDIPILFAETKQYLIVTSPLWQNHYTEKTGDTAWGAGVYTEEANKAIAPLIKALREYCDAHK